MTRSIQEVVIVKEGGLIELRASDIPVGTRANVSVTFEDLRADMIPAAKNMSDLFGVGRSFKSVEEVDRYIREERDSWGE